MREIKIEKEKECEYFKLVKVSTSGDKIGYYNSDIDPEDSWSTKNVDNAAILNKEEVYGVMTIEKVKKEVLNSEYSVYAIGVY